MPTDPKLELPADTLAADLFTSLTADASFDLPAIDFESDKYSFPTATDNPLYVEVNKITEADLTDRTVGGSGLFDGLMKTMNQHIRGEYDNGRITGEEYSKTYIAMIQGALSSSVQYLLATDQAYWQAILAQKQAQAAEVNLITVRIQAEIAKAQLASARIETNTMATNYALAKMKLPTEYVQHALLTSQFDGSEFNNDFILPQQLTQLEKQNERMTFEIDFLLPKELEKADKTIEQATSTISMTEAQKDQVLFQTSAILPAQVIGIQAETSIKDYQVETFLPAQVAGYTQDTAGKAYTNEFILPAQLDSVREQTEGHRAKTSETRMDGVTLIEGAIGKQKDLHQKQIDSYQRDAEAKVAKMLLDTWITQKSLDEGLAPPDSITDPNINTVMTTLRANLDLS